MRYMVAGKAHWMALGSPDSIPPVTLADAVKRAADAQAMAKAGVDPIAARKAKVDVEAARAGIAFAHAAKAFIALNEGGWKNPKHKARWHSTIAFWVLPKIGDPAVAAVDNHHVADLLMPIWADKRETANRVRSRVEFVLNFAIAKKWRDGPNPAVRDLVTNLLPKRAKRVKQHHASMHWRDMPALMAGLAEQDSVSALASRFVVLTATRTGETLGARSGEIDRLRGSSGVASMSSVADAEG